MNLTDVLEANGIQCHPGNKKGEINIDCPFCVDQGETEDTRHRLGINIYSGKAHCFNCNWSSRRSTIEKLLKQLQIIEKVDKSSKKHKVKKPKFVKKLPDGYEPLLPLNDDKDCKAAYLYLRKRRVSKAQIKKHKMGVCFIKEYAYRIVIPVWYKGKIYGFQTRDFTNRQKKRYLNSGGRKTLFNRRPKKKRKSIAILIEGIFDALAADRVFNKIADSMATLGPELKGEQIKMLKGYSKIIRVPDNDRTGYNSAIKDAEKLKKAKLPAYIGFLKGWKDISKALEKYDEKAIQKIADEAVEFSSALKRKMQKEVAFEHGGRWALNRMTPYGREENGRNTNRWKKPSVQGILD